MLLEQTDRSRRRDDSMGFCNSVNMPFDAGHHHDAVGSSSRQKVRSPLKLLVQK